MLANTTHLKGLVIRATDGEIGTVDQLYFDDESWAIRYVTVKTGSWLQDREVLISPFSVTNVDWPAKRLMWNSRKSKSRTAQASIHNGPFPDSTRPNISAITAIPIIGTDLTYGDKAPLPP